MTTPAYEHCLNPACQREQACQSEAFCIADAEKDIWNEAIEAVAKVAEQTMWLEPHERTEYGEGSHVAAEEIACRARALKRQ